MSNPTYIPSDRVFTNLAAAALLADARGDNFAKVMLSLKIAEFHARHLLNSKPYKDLEGHTMLGMMQLYSVSQAQDAFMAMESPWDAVRIDRKVAKLHKRHARIANHFAPSTHNEYDL